MQRACVRVQLRWRPVRSSAPALPRCVATPRPCASASISGAIAMSHTPDLNDCSAASDGASTLTPISPHLGMHYHFGMLLGVDDFETEQAYHRGKARLHNAWLHRDGAVWGFEIK